MFKKLLDRLSLTTRTILLAMLVGVMLWAVVDLYSTREMRHYFETNLLESLEEDAIEFRLQFSEMVRAHTVGVQIFVSQVELIEYIKRQDWSVPPPAEPPVYFDVPRWFPKPTTLRTFVNPRHAVLMDTEGNVREIYNADRTHFPEFLLHPSKRLLELSRNESYLTELEGIPHLVTSEHITDAEGNLLGTLILSSPFDEAFLVAAQRLEYEQVITVLISGTPETIVTSSKSNAISPGTLIRDLQEEYLIMKQDFFEYGSSDMTFKFASLLPRENITLSTERFVSAERFQRGVIAIVMLSFFVMIIFLITKRIERLTERISLFSEEALGGKRHLKRKGNQLAILEERFQLLTEEVLESADTIRYEAAEKVKREEELANKEQQIDLLQSVTETASMGVAIERDGELHPINSKMADYFNHYEDKDCFNVGRGFNGEVEFEFTDGTTHTLHLMVPELAMAEKVVMAIDITDRKQAEAELIRRGAQIKLLLDSTAEAIYGTDMDGRCTFANPSCVALLGARNESDLLGKSMHSLIHRTSHSEGPPSLSDCSLCKAMFNGRNFHSGAEVLGKLNGNTFFAECWSHPMKDRGKVVGAVVTFLDISERKRLEDQLRQSQKMEAIGTLTGGIAHDFNNIITAIIGFSEILHDSLPEDDKLREYAKLVMDSADRAATLTNSLLAFSREQVSNPRPVDLNRVSRGISKIIGRIIGEDIELRLQLSPEPLMAMADKGQIEQVLINLASNARDAMPEGGILVISSELATPSFDLIQSVGLSFEGPYALITVSDTGTGMDEETQNRIFEPFYTTKEVGKGTGLGLAIVYGIIHQHKGFISVYSEKGEGTTFKLYLPFLRETEDTENVELEEDFEKVKGTETIFVAEDDEGIRQLLRITLEHAGYRVILAVDGEDAISKLKDLDEDISLLLLDVIMPKKNGKDVYEEAHKLYPEAKLIFMSGYAADIIKGKGILDKGASYISKPLVPRDVLRAIREKLKSD